MPTNDSPNEPNLIGSIKVEPTSVQPGQPVLVEVCDASGKPISDPAISVVIQGVPGNSRYFQFPRPGEVNLFVIVAKGQSQQTAQASVTVKGKPLAFRKTLAEPDVTEMPIIKISAVPGQPYAASFSVGNPRSITAALAAEVEKSNAAHIPNPKKPVPHPLSTISTKRVAIPKAEFFAMKPAAKPAEIALAAPADAMGLEFSKNLKSLPAMTVKRIAPKIVKTGATTKATLSGILAPGSELKTSPEATRYRWDFGDGHTLATQSPEVTHDYSASIEAGDVTRSFNVSCTVEHDKVTVVRTLVLHSAYGLCKRTGVIVPHVTGNAYAHFHNVAFSGLLTVRNIEAAPITLDSMACVPLSDSESDVPAAPRFKRMQNPVTIGAKSASAIGVNIPVDELQVAGSQINAFTVHYAGSMQDGGKKIPVRFSYVFRVPLADQWILHSPGTSVIWGDKLKLDGVLKAVSDVVTHPNVAVSKPGGQVFDPATRTVGIALSKEPAHPATQAHVKKALHAGLLSIAHHLGPVALTKPFHLPQAKGAGKGPDLKPLDIQFNPLSPPPVAAGNECYPDDISDADAATAAAEQLVCQLTSQVETVTVPAAFQNALKGDVILSPVPVGSGDLIAAMFKALNPPQHHGHSGMMTANFYEITHCTASVDRIKANVNKDDLGIPTSLNSDMLKYAWPGTITQSVDDAIASREYIDPDDKAYSMQSFNTDPEGEGYEVIPPLVVKPLPEDEPVARPKLRQAADLARSKGARFDSSGKMQSPPGCYYSFYCYTAPQISAGFMDAAGAEAGWAQGKSPAVCSSFVWLSLKASGIPLVTTNQYEALTDFSPLAVEGGARVGAKTLDGLIYYPEAERKVAADALRQMFMAQALGQEFGLGTIPGINEATAGPLADQLLNTFAFGDSTMVGSDAWKKPGDSNAVSPDNIMFWNPKYYGYVEPLQFLPKHTEEYTVSRWTRKQATSGSITGKVTRGGSPVAGAHVWVYLPGGETYTAADGSYSLNEIPIGAYSLKAQAVVSEHGIEEEFTNGQNGESVTLTSANAHLHKDIALQGNQQSYRRADFQYSISCDHGDLNPFNKHGILKAGPFHRSVDVNPGQVTNALTYTFDYNGGGYFHINYVFTVALLQDYSLEVTLVGTMYDDDNPAHVQDQYTIPPFNVPMGATWSGQTSMENSNGYHNGPAVFTFSVTNAHQTG